MIEMVKGVAQLMKTDIAVSISGIAGPKTCRNDMDSLLYNGKVPQNNDEKTCRNDMDTIYNGKGPQKNRANCTIYKKLRNRFTRK